MHTEIIDHIIKICDFPADSVMVKHIEQQQWSTLAHVVYVRLEEVEEFFTVKIDGITFEETSMIVHVHRFQAFLLYYRSKICWG
jgi:hypothetical protein